MYGMRENDMLYLKLRYIGPDDYVCEERYFDNSTTGERI